MKIIFQREKCIGCGSCAALCSKLFEMSEDGKSTLKGGKKNIKLGKFELEVEKIDYDCAKEAEMACPAEIIKTKG